MKKDRVFFLPNHEPESSDFPPLEGLDITKTEKGEPFTGNYDQSRLWKQLEINVGVNVVVKGSKKGG